MALRRFVGVHSAQDPRERSGGGLLLATSCGAVGLLDRPRRDIPCTGLVFEWQGRTPKRSRPQPPGDGGRRDWNVIKD